MDFHLDQINPRSGGIIVDADDDVGAVVETRSWRVPDEVGMTSTVNTPAEISAIVPKLMSELPLMSSLKVTV